MDAKLFLEDFLASLDNSKNFEIVNDGVYKDIPRVKSVESKGSIYTDQLFVANNCYNSIGVASFNNNILDPLFEQFLIKNGFVYTKRDNLSTLLHSHDYTIYVNADKAKAQRIKAEPHDGNIEIVQREFAVTSSADKNPVLSTSGIGPCRGLLIYDPFARVGGVAHVDTQYSELAAVKNIVDKLKELGGKNSFLVILII